MEEGEDPVKAFDPNFNSSDGSSAIAGGAASFPPLWGDEVVARAKALCGEKGKEDIPSNQSGFSGNNGADKEWYVRPLLLMPLSVIRNSDLMSPIFVPRESRPQGNKRGRHDGSPNSVDFPVKKRRDDSFVFFFNYAQVERGQRIRVEELSHISAHFRNEIDKLEGSFVVKMGGITIKRGYGRVQCDDPETFKWASSVVTTMANGAFKICTEEEVFYSTHTVGMFLRERARPDPAKLFPAISVMNGNFNTSKWRLQSAQPTKGGHFLLIEMDTESYGLIQPPAKLYYYEDRLSFKLNPTKKRSQK
jgi:hypothetical protein